MSTLMDTKIVDLKRSVIDEKNSDLAKYRYEYKEKKYINMDTLQEDDMWFCWCHYNPKDGYWMFESWKQDGWDAVIAGEDPYVVEGASVNGSNYWQYKDVVLMRCKWSEELKRREESQKMATGGKPRLEQYSREMDQLDPQFTQGAGIGPDEIAALRRRGYKQ